MKKVINGFGHLGADAVYLLQVFYAGAGHSFGGAEVGQEGAFAAGADAGDVVQWAFGDLFFAAQAMAAYDKAVGFIA